MTDSAHSPGTSQRGSQSEARGHPASLTLFHFKNLPQAGIYLGTGGHARRGCTSLYKQAVLEPFLDHTWQLRIKRQRLSCPYIKQWCDRTWSTVFSSGRRISKRILRR
uniref:Uncharacterized protein n=1 Tax=Sphaerodactylus townsendi TaxID=933632 RepID=A0ACB8FT84_9SAUR